VLVLSAWEGPIREEKIYSDGNYGRRRSGVGSCHTRSQVAANDDNFGRFQFQPDTLVVSRSVYSGDASILNVGQTLPPGGVPGTVTLPLLAGGSTTVAIPRSSKAPGGRANDAFARPLFHPLFSNPTIRVVRNGLRGTATSFCPSSLQRVAR
jgi:hypothetical protein